MRNPAIAPIPPRPSREVEGPESLTPVVLLLALAATISACSSNLESGDEESGLVTDLAAAGAAVTNLPDEPSASASSRFWSHWGDGRAEMNSYRATMSRYGEPREGELVLIYVTEPHDRRSWIKDDRVDSPHRVEVMKLNVSLDFLTGIYPYSVMTSVFSPVDDWGVERFQPVKIGHTVQEWCGHYLHQVWSGREALRSLRMSYFPSDGEGITEMDVRPGTLYEDALLIQLRELDGPFADGGDWEGWIVPSLWTVRRGAATPEPGRGTITRDELRAESDAGAPVTRFTLRYHDYRREYDVESEPPGKILGWRTSLGDTVRLAESLRSPYWTENDPDGRRLRVELGLSPTSSGVPPVAGASPGPSTSPPPGGGGGC